MKFSALNADFNSPIRDLLGSRRLAQSGVKDATSLKVAILPFLARLA